MDDLEDLEDDVGEAIDLVEARCVTRERRDDALADRVQGDERDTL